MWCKKVSLSLQVISGVSVIRAYLPPGDTHYNISRMKARVSKVMISLAVIFTIAAAAVHHHHHGEVMCMLQHGFCSETSDGTHHPERGASDIYHVQHFMAAGYTGISDVHSQQLWLKWLTSPSALTSAETRLSLPAFLSFRASASLSCSAYSRLRRTCHGFRAPPQA